MSPRAVKIGGLLRLLILPVVILAALLVSYLRLFDSYELETLDFRFLARPKIPVTDKVVLVEIGEDSIEKLGRFPFDRSYHALLIKALKNSGAKAVIFDIFFSESQAGDGELASAMKDSGNVYLPFVFDIEPKARSRMISGRGYTARTIEPLKGLAKREGHINIGPDIDGKFRRVPLYVTYEGKPYPYLSFAAVSDYLGLDEDKIKIAPGKGISCGGGLEIPLDDNSNMMINFSGKWGTTYRHYSYVDILQSYLAPMSGERPNLDLGAFKDKVCIVGLTAAGTVDLHPNPFETLYPGMGIHAEVFNSILNRRFISRLAREANLAILIVLGLLVGIMTLKTKPLKGLFILILAILFFISIGILLFDLSGVWMDLFYPVLAMGLVYLSLTLYKYIVEWKRRLVLENELDIAKKIQESFLPKDLPSMEGIDIAASMFTARKVGGDLYDFVESGPDKLGVMIGDVSGKGIPASLFMAMVTGRFKFFATTEAEPRQVLIGLNNRLVKEASSNLFVTMLYMALDLKNKNIKFANGGHLPLMHLSQGREPVRYLDVAEGTPLGLMEGEYSQNEASFKEGDIFVLYTDGITEAMNAKSDMYGKERLAAVVEANRKLSARDILARIDKDVRRFEPIRHQHDDMTLIVIKIAWAALT